MLILGGTGVDTFGSAHGAAPSRAEPHAAVTFVACVRLFYIGAERVPKRTDVREALRTGLLAAEISGEAAIRQQAGSGERRRMTMRKNTLAVLIMLGACGVARAQDYFDFNSIPDLPDEPSVQVDLNAALLGIAAAAAGGSDPEMAALLAAIEGVRVRVYARLEDAAEVASFMDDASGRLEQDGWHQVVSAQDGEDKVRVYARLVGDVMDGLTIMALCEDEAAFVNVAGRISAEQFGRIAETIGADDVIGYIPEFARNNASREARD